VECIYVKSILMILIRQIIQICNQFHSSEFSSRKLHWNNQYLCWRWFFSVHQRKVSITTHYRWPS